MDYFQVFCAIGMVLLAIYYYYTSTFDYWKNREIPGPKPTFFVGNLFSILTKTSSMSDTVKMYYDQFKNEPVFGIFEGRTPVLVINDLDLVKDVLIRDFSLFVDRGFRLYPKVEPLAQHLFLLEAERWRPMRAKLSPIFTSGKLKEMFHLIVECSENLEKYLNKITAQGGSTECRELAAKFTTDIIGSCVFGINMNALSNEDSEFRNMGRKLFAPTLKTQIRDFCRQMLPTLYKIIGKLLQQDEVNNFFSSVVTETMKYRKENNIMRPDFINMLMELQHHPEKLDNIELTDDLLTAQALVFFVAGFETSSSTIANGLYEIAQHPDVQDKLRQEIRENYKKHNGVLTYEQIKDMKYLDKVFKETLRKYPILPMLTRQAMENYTFKGTKISIPKKTKLWIPAYGIQWDPRYYPNPDIFDPERFNDDAVAARHPMTYLPFGDGPRNCIGARFAHYQSKVGILTIIRNHNVDVCEKTLIPFKTDPRSFMLSLKGGVHLKISKVQD